MFLPCLNKVYVCMQVCLYVQIWHILTPLEFIVDCLSQHGLCFVDGFCNSQNRHCIYFIVIISLRISELQFITITLQFRERVMKLRDNFTNTAISAT